MGDLISRQAAIDLFPNDALEWDTKGGYVAPHIVRRMIEELPSAQQWIPCSERLPKETEEYLITCKDRHGDTFVKKTMYFSDDELWWDISSFETVTAWMPVPSPYKENYE